MANIRPGRIYGVRRRETAPSLAALRLGRKKQRFSGTNQKPELPRPFGTGPLKPCPQGPFFAFLTFLRLPDFSSPESFSRPFRLFPGPTNCPWVSEDVFCWILSETRTTTWNLPGPSGTRDCINIVNLSHPSPLFCGG